MRRVLVGLLAAVVVVAMVTALWRYVRAESPHGQLELTEIDGEVQVQRAVGDAAAARPGQILHADDRVSTGAAGRAVLSLGRDTHIRVGPTSSLQVVAVDEAGVSLELENGALQATVRPEAGAVRVNSRGRAVLATSGEFAVGVSDDILQVSATRGSLSLSGVDQTRLEEGQQATVVDRHAEVGAVPEELLLAVDWPQEARTRSELTTVTGTTQPGARVTLSGAFGERTVTANAEGRFVAEVPLAEGDNPVEFEAVDILGRQTTVEGALPTRDTQGPSFRGGVDYGGR
ncbi:MAG: FecR domain-containing protein [Myxococcota bacterium]